MRPPSLHSKFFSSLKQVEKRLKSEASSTSLPPQLDSNPSIQKQQQPSTSTDQSDLSSPFYLFCENQTPMESASRLQDSDPPAQEFLSYSSEVRNEDPPPPSIIRREVDQTVEDGKDDIEQLIELLGLLDMKEEKRLDLDLDGGNGLNSEVLGLKGPKSVKEMERLDGWIKYYLSNDNNGSDGCKRRKEPLRLVHLLLGKAAACGSCEDSNGGFEEHLEFPSTVGEFLEHDPPT